MWAYRLEGPLQFARHEVEQPAPEALPDGYVLLKFRAGGVCGSDIARCRDTGRGPQPEPYGRSLHEIVGDVVASKSDLAVGTRVVGWVSDTTGLREFVPTAANQVLPLDGGLDDVHAVPMQPLACVLWAMARLGSVDRARAAVIGLGPIGLLFAHALRRAGATSVVGVDSVDRSDVADSFGLDSVVHSSSRAWVNQVGAGGTYDLVVEAVGHQVGTLDDAVSVTSAGGRVVYFGNPDDAYYPVPFSMMMDRNLILYTGRTPAPDRRDALLRARAYLERHPRLMDRYVTDVLPVNEAQAAYLKASRPSRGQLKIVLDGSA